MRDLETTNTLKISNLYAALIAVGLSVIGGTAIYLSYFSSWWSTDSTWPLIIRNIGSLLIVSTALSFVWQLYGKRAFMSEVLARANLAPDVEDTGIRQICMSSNEVNWLQLFELTSNLDLCLAYAGAWRGQYRFQLEHLVKRKGARIRLILPDPDDENLMKSIARSWQLSDQQLCARIREAKDSFLRYVSIAKEHGATCEIWYTHCHPVLSLYKFDHFAVASLYAYVESQPTPHFIAVRSGSFFRFVENQFEKLTDDSRKMSRMLACPEESAP